MLLSSRDGLKRKEISIKMVSDQLFVQIDKDDKKSNFKSLVVRRGHTIREVINAAIDDYLKEDGKPAWLLKN